MRLHTATATGDAAGYALFVLALLFVTLGYFGSCWLWPFGTCRHCHGTGKRRSPFTARVFGFCRHCDGTGRRLRIGRRLINHLRDLHRNAR